MKNTIKMLGIIALVVLIGFAFINAATTPGSITPAAPEPMTSKTALEYFKDEGVKFGWNIGNTFDATPNNANGATGEPAVETAWGNPVVTQELINGVKNQGFNIVRIAVTWIGHIGPAPDYKVNEARLKRVAEVVNMVHKADMKAIINIHHDGNYFNPPNTWGFLKFAEVLRGTANNEQVKDELTRVWTQIANYFRNYGDYLIFETMNEVHSGNWGDNRNPGYSSYSYETEQERLLEWNQTALNAIRATGGNNAKRFVTIPGLGGSWPSTVISAYKRGKLLPNDGSNGTNKLIVTVHNYNPEEYTVAVDTGEPRNTLTPSELANINDEAYELKKVFFDNGIAVYYGECGSPTNYRSDKDDKVKNTHLEYMKLVAKSTHSNGIIPIFWDNGFEYKMIERTDGTVKTGLWANTIAAIKTGISEATWPAPSSGNDDGLKWENGSKAGLWTWGVYTDGTSTITQKDNNDDSYTFSGTVTSAIQYGFAAWSATPNFIMLPYLKAASSISFRANGAAKKYVIIMRTNFDDFSDYQTTFTAGKNKLITIPMSSFVPPGWGASKGTKFDKSKATKFEIQATADVTKPGAFEVTISDLKLNK